MCNTVHPTHSWYRRTNYTKTFVLIYRYPVFQVSGDGVRSVEYTVCYAECVTRLEWHTNNQEEPNYVSTDVWSTCDGIFVFRKPDLPCPVMQLQVTAKHIYTRLNVSVLHTPARLQHWQYSDQQLSDCKILRTCKMLQHCSIYSILLIFFFFF